MKWGDETDRVSEQTTAALLKVLGPTGFFILLVITAFAMLSGAGDKWT